LTAAKGMHACTEEANLIEVQHTQPVVLFILALFQKETVPLIDLLLSTSQVMLA
jgi:hypothetical protein